MTRDYRKILSMNLDELQDPLYKGESPHNEKATHQNRKCIEPDCSKDYRSKKNKKPPQ